MPSLNLSAISKRVDRLSGPEIDLESIVVQFIKPGALQPPITQATCEDRTYTRLHHESEQDFLARIKADHPPSRGETKLIFAQ
jgi:hypothetical protein